MDDFFSFVSKVVLVIPIFIVIISLFFKFNSPKTGLINQAPTAIPTILTTKTNSFKFDLKGPIVCENLYINDKKVLLINNKTNYLLNGDCLYIWETNTLIGQKKCGLSNYIGIAETYLGFMSVDDLINNSLIKDKIKNKDIDVAKVIKSCKREVIKDKKVFEIPTKVIFKD